MREAIIDLSDGELADLGYGDLISLCREATLHDIELLEDEGKRAVPQIEVEDRLDEDRLDSLECVVDWELVSETGDTYLYLLEVVALEMPESAPEAHEELVGPCKPTVTDQGLLLSLVGSQETIRDMIRHFQDAGITPDLQKLGEYEGGTRAFDGLTERQVEVMRTAYDMGFYDVPRSVTTDEIASEIGIDPATVSEHLQRAERNLLSQQLTS